MKPRGRPFEPGNKYGTGRRKGSRNKTTLMAQKLLEEYSEPIVRKCIVDALKSDGASRRLCMDRILPVPRDAPIRAPLKKTITAQDVDEASQQVVQAVASGRISPRSGEAMAHILEFRRKAIETAELQIRLERLEEQAAEQKAA